MAPVAVSQLPVGVLVLYLKKTHFQAIMRLILTLCSESCSPGIM